jgi:hypothetical protein
MEEDFSPQQSLQLIQHMISKTKAGLSHNRFYFLLWGWISFIAILGQFFLKVVVQTPYHYNVWILTFVGIIVSIIYGKRQHSKAKVRTYIGDSMRNLWLGLGISFGVISFLFSNMKEGWLHAYPFFIVFYGLGTFVSGKILQFRPFMIGGIINWLLACTAVFFSFDYQMLFGAAAIATSYLIPAYLLKGEREHNV